MFKSSLGKIGAYGLTVFKANPSENAFGKINIGQIALQKNNIFKIDSLKLTLLKFAVFKDIIMKFYDIRRNVFQNRAEKMVTVQILLLGKGFRYLRLQSLGFYGFFYKFRLVYQIRISPLYSGISLVS
jgi:hypothetical protein